MRFRRLALLFVLTITVAAAGCSRDPAPTAPLPDEPPAANTPENAVLRWKWAWTHRDTIAMKSLLTDDFAFVFATTDSAGNAYRDRPWARLDERICVSHMFHGGGAAPPVTSVQLDLDPVLRKSSDPRPGRGNRWHWVIQTSASLTMRTAESSWETGGRVLLFVVRGDSAAIPADLWAAGTRPDSTRWWIERWEDQTVGSGGGVAEALHPQPSSRLSWGTIKARYR